MHPGNPRLCFQPFSQHHGPLALRLHAQTQGFQALDKHPGIERAHTGTGRTNEPENIIHGLFRADHGTTEATPLPVQIFGRAVDNQVSTQLDRFLQGRRAETVIHHQQRPVVVGKLGQGGNVTDFRQWIRRRFQKQHFRFRANRRLPLGKITHVHQRGIDTKFLQVAVVNHVGGAEHTARADDVVAWCQQSEKRAADRRHTGGESHTGLTAFQSCKPLLKGAYGRVGKAGVDVTGLFTTKPRRCLRRVFVDEAGGHEDRIRMRHFIRAQLRRTDCQGFHTQGCRIQIITHGLFSLSCRTRHATTRQRFAPKGSIITREKSRVDSQRRIHSSGSTPQLPCCVSRTACPR